MRYLKYVALLTILMVPLAYSQAQIGVGIGVGVGPGYVNGPPVCAYGYYNYYPYACAPYGYYGPNWFVDGFFIGAGPWYHWGHPGGFWNRGYAGRGFYGRPGYYGRGYVGRGIVAMAVVTPAAMRVADSMAAMPSMVQVATMVEVGTE